VIDDYENVCGKNLAICAQTTANGALKNIATVVVRKIAIFTEKISPNHQK
jgi:hypothetical protein